MAETVDLHRVRVNYSKNTPEKYGWKPLKEVPEEKRAPVITQTKEELDNHEAKLTGSNLDNIWVSRTEALKLAQEVLNISDPFDITEFKNAIKKYQKEHNIWIDGKIGKETYIEMKAWVDLLQAQKWIDTYGISKKTQEKIIWDLENALENWNFEWENIKNIFILLNVFQENNKLAKNEEYKDFLKKTTDISQKYSNSPKWKKTYKEKVEWRITNLHDIVNNPTPENIEKFVKDPTLLMAWGLLFLFGVWTDMSFMKRLGILMWGIIFWPYVMKKLWVGKFWEDLKQSSKNWVVHDAWEAASETSKEVSNWVTKNAKNAWTAITWFFGEAGDKIWELKLSDFEGSFNKVSSKLESANKSKDKSEQIKEESLKNLTGVLLSDKIFVNLTQDKLKNVNEDNINQYLTAESQEKLTKEDKWVIKKYIALLSEQFQTGDTRVRDLLLTTEMVDKIKEAYYKTDTEFVPEAKTFNDKINKLIKSLLATPDKEKHFAALQLAKALKDWDVSKFDVKSFKLWDYETDVKSVIVEFNEYKTVYKPAIEQLNKIDVSDDDWRAFKVDYKLFEKVSKINIKNIYLKADFDNRLLEKKIEIFEEARKAWLEKEAVVINGNTYTVEWYLKELNKEKEKVLKKQLEEFNNKAFLIEHKLLQIKSSIDFDSAIEKLKEIEEEFDVISPTKLNDLLKQAKDAWNDLARWAGLGKIFPTENVSEIDKVKNKRLVDLSKQIAKKHLEIEKDFNTDLQKRPTNTTIIEYAAARLKSLDDFTSTKLEELKKNQLKKSFNDLVNTPVIWKINQETDLWELEIIYSDYLIDIKWAEELAWESVKKAYEEKIEELKKYEILNKTNLDKTVNKILKDSWVFDFFEWKTELSKKVLKNKKLKQIWYGFNNNTTLESIISTFKDIADKLNPYNTTEEIQEEAKKIYKNLKDNVNIEVKWYINNQIDKLLKLIK